MTEEELMAQATRVENRDGVIFVTLPVSSLSSTEELAKIITNEVQKPPKNEHKPPKK